ncbi:hypothetical protein LSH36_369g00003 [Paralvinella palmiformis]|uniref:G-protein coupled receptors family 2 profile 2 domain-containing protein n=1 Tax=Paralvinella palmiformis TaxID=53620 RepID=A0AAD9JEQ7_9ANNE|nr:hypothetical protein LSH36_369g00003 [Paralvinella palmiformis]
MRAVNNPDTNQTRKAVRATLILIPLLGLQFILFPFAPEEKDQIIYHVYRMGSAFVTSFQGFFVALIFCFLNGEILSLVKRKWEQHQLMHGKTRNCYAHTAYTMAEHTNNAVANGNRLVDDKC